VRVTDRIGRLPVLLLASGAASIVMIAALATWASSAASHTPELRVVGAYVPQPASPDVAAAYFTITDSGDDADELTGVASDASAGTMMMHGSTGQTMEMVSAVPVPAHGRLVFGSGGYQVMLEKPARRLRQGDHLKLTLRFRRSPAITVEAPVKPVGYRRDGT
jgi:periplasmic copper chaperone A